MSYWDDFKEYALENKYDIDDFIHHIKGLIEEAFQVLDERYHPAILGEDNGEGLYALIRNKEPEKVVETGVCNGFSSSIILKAMEDNGKGELYSVDLPTYIEPGEETDRRTSAVVPSTKESGWVVPDSLGKRWRLTIGNTFYETPKVLEKLCEIDMFIHDSEHTYEGMMFEYSLAWKHLKKGGLLISDNVDHSDAFKDFSTAKDRQRYSLGSLGILIK